MSIATDHIEVRYRPSDSAGAWHFIRVPAGQGSVKIPGVDRGTSYDIEARAIGVNGQASAWVAQTHVVADASLLPLDPTGLAAVSVADGVHLSWTVGNTQRPDVEYEVWRTGDLSGAPDPAGWAQISTTRALRFTDGVTDGVIRWYRVRAHDFSGHESNYTANVNSRGKTIGDGLNYPIILGYVPPDAAVLEGTSPGGTGVNNFCYRQISTRNWTFNAGDHIQYDCYADPANPEIKFGIDFGCSDGSTFRGSAAVDQNGLASHPATDLQNFAKGKWYHRDFAVPAYVGKTVTSWALACEGDAAGFYRCRFANIMVTGGGGPLLPTMGHVDIYVGGSVNGTTVWPGAGDSYSGVHVYSVDLSSGAVDMDFHLADGGTYKRLAFVDPDHTIHASTGLNPQGSILPNQAIIISITYTDTSISLSWSAQSLLRSDGSSLTLNAGSQAYSSLTASHTYYIYPRITVSTGNLGFSNGSPPPTSPNATMNLQQALDGFIPIAPIVQSTAATGGSGSGTGGGGDRCPHEDELVEIKDLGVVKAIQVVMLPGKFIKGRNMKTGEEVWRKILAAHTRPCAAWYAYKGHKVSPCEPVMIDGKWVSAWKIPGAVLDTSVGRFVAITVQADESDECNYLLLGGEEELLIHNVNLLPC